jgi:hypothetical protein
MDSTFPLDSCTATCTGATFSIAKSGDGEEVMLIDVSRSMRLPRIDLRCHAFDVQRSCSTTPSLRATRIWLMGFALVKSLFASQQDDSGTLYSLPSMGLRALKLPSVQHSILQIWQYLGPFVSSCGEGVAGLHRNNLFVPLFEVTAGITAVVKMTTRGQTLWRETLLVLATTIDMLTQATVRTIKGGWGGRATLRDIVVKQRIYNPNRVDRILSDGLANVQQAASRGSTLSGDQSHLLLDKGTGFKIGTVVGRMDSSGGKNHLISWAAGEEKESRSRS